MYVTSATPLHQSQSGVQVVFMRGSSLSKAFTARRTDQTDDESEMELDLTTREFLLPRESVRFGDDEIHPRTGDRIIEGSHVFEILPTYKGKPAVVLAIGEFEWLVHAKLVT